jgi:hypothetical protein
MTDWQATHKTLEARKLLCIHLLISFRCYYYIMTSIYCESPTRGLSYPRHVEPLSRSSGLSPENRHQYGTHLPASIWSMRLQILNLLMSRIGKPSRWGGEWPRTIVDNVCGQCPPPCTLNTSFSDFKNSRRIVAVKNIKFSSLSFSLYFFSGSQMSLTRLSHSFPHFHIVFIYWIVTSTVPTFLLQFEACVYKFWIY